MDYSLSSLQYQESDLSHQVQSKDTPAHLNLQDLYKRQSHRRDIGPFYPSAPSLELLSDSKPSSTVLSTRTQIFSYHPGAAVAPEPASLSQRQSHHPIPEQPLQQGQAPVSSALWPSQSLPQPTLNFDGSSIMDSTSWSGNNASAHQTVGPIPMGFEWPRDQNLASSDATARPIGLQGTFQTTSNNQDGGSNGAGNAVIHSQSSSLPGGPGHLGADNGLGGGGVHHSTDPLSSSLAASTLQGDLQVRTTPSTPSREDFHHSHPHHTQQQQQSSSQQHQQPPPAPQQQQQLHVHHTHSPYHHGSLSGHELSSHEQQQQQHQQQLQQQSFQPQHAAYASGHYYAEQEQHDAYEHDRMHSGGLVGHPYAHSHDNLATLTPPPSAPVPQHDLPPVRARLTNTIWEDEHTFCFQVDVKGVCVARRADNNMVNGTKLLNVVGMSRGKRDGILKNEKGRVVVKVGAMHLKGVWIPLDRAIHHAKAHNIEESLYPLLVDDPTTFLYQHPHSTSVADVRWSSQAQQQHGYHDSDNSPKARHSDMHPNHHFNQGVHGDYYSHQHHSIFRGHGVNSPHGSPHGSNGSVSGDDDPNLVSPFDYRMQSSMASGGLIGIPSGGASSVSDLRSGNHHAAYYGHQSSPNQYYGAHVQQKYQEPIIHPGQHQLQLGGPLANDSPPPLSNAGHDGPQNRLQANLLTGQKRGYGTNVPESAHSYYPYPAHAQKSHNLPDAYPADPNTFGLASSGMNTGNFSPPVSMPPSEPHSPMSQQHQSHHPQEQHGDLQMQNAQGVARHSHGAIVQPLNPPSKRPRQISRGISLTAESPIPSSGQWYGRDEGFDRAGAQSVAASHHSMSSGDTPGPTPMNYGMASDGNNGMYYDGLALAQQQQQQQKTFNAAREGEAGLAGRPRFLPGTAQTPLQYGTTGSSSPQRSRSRLSSFQDGAPAGTAMTQPGTMSPFGRMQNSMSPDESKQSGYVRAQSGPEGDSNVQLLKVEGVSGNFHDTASWT